MDESATQQRKKTIASTSSTQLSYQPIFSSIPDDYFFLPFTAPETLALPLSEAGLTETAPEQKILPAFLDKLQPTEVLADLAEKLSQGPYGSLFDRFSSQIMADPVVTPDGNTFERESILKTGIREEKLTSLASAIATRNSLFQAHPAVANSILFYLPQHWVKSLKQACLSGDVPTIRTLTTDLRLICWPLDFERGEYDQERGSRILHIACAQGKLDSIVALLTAAEQQPGLALVLLLQKDHAGFLPIQYAMQRMNEDPRIMRVLAHAMGRHLASVGPVSFSADSSSHLRQVTALHLAAMHNNEEALRALLDKTPALGICDTNGNTALHVAAGCGSLNVVKLLLAASAPTACINGQGQTPLGLAKKFRHSTVVAELAILRDVVGTQLQQDQQKIDALQQEVELLRRQLSQERQEKAYLVRATTQLKAESDTLQELHANETIWQQSGVFPSQAALRRFLIQELPQHPLAVQLIANLREGKSSAKQLNSQTISTKVKCGVTVVPGTSLVVYDRGLELCLSDLENPEKAVLVLGKFADKLSGLSGGSFPNQIIAAERFTQHPQLLSAEGSALYWWNNTNLTSLAPQKHEMPPYIDGTVAILLTLNQAGQAAVVKNSKQGNAPHIEIWDVQKQQVVQLLQGNPKAAISCLACLPEQRLISADTTGVLTIWDWSTGRLLSSFKTNETPITAMVTMPDGRRVATIGQKTLRIWSLAETAKKRLLASENLPSYRSVTFSALSVQSDKWLVTGNSKGEIQYWEVRTSDLSKRRSFSASQSAIRSLAVLADDSVVSLDITGNLLAFRDGHQLKLDLSFRKELMRAGAELQVAKTAITIVTMQPMPDSFKKLASTLKILYPDYTRILKFDTQAYQLKISDIPEKICAEMITLCEQLGAQQAKPSPSLTTAPVKKSEIKALPRSRMPAQPPTYYGTSSPAFFPAPAAQVGPTSLPAPSAPPSEDSTPKSPGLFVTSPAQETEQ